MSQRVRPLEDAVEDNFDSDFTSSDSSDWTNSSDEDVGAETTKVRGGVPNEDLITTVASTSAGASNNAHAEDKQGGIEDPWKIEPKPLFSFDWSLEDRPNDTLSVSSGSWVDSSEEDEDGKNSELENDLDEGTTSETSIEWIESTTVIASTSGGANNNAHAEDEKEETKDPWKIEAKPLFSFDWSLEERANDTLSVSSGSWVDSSEEDEGGNNNNELENDLDEGPNNNYELENDLDEGGNNNYELENDLDEGTTSETSIEWVESNWGEGMTGSQSVVHKRVDMNSADFRLKFALEKCREAKAANDSSDPDQVMIFVNYRHPEEMETIRAFFEMSRLDSFAAMDGTIANRVNVAKDFADRFYLFLILEDGGSNTCKDEKLLITHDQVAGVRYVINFELTHPKTFTARMQLVQTSLKDQLTVYTFSLPGENEYIFQQLDPAPAPAHRQQQQRKYQYRRSK